MYEVLLERSAERDLKALSAEIFHRVIPRIRDLANSPRPSGCHKITGSIGGFVSETTASSMRSTIRRGL